MAYNLIGIGIIETPEDLATIDPEDPDTLTFSLLSKRFELPNGAQLMEIGPYSTIIAEAPEEGSEEDDLGDLPYKAFSFTPDNRADLGSEQDWTLTLIESSEDNSSLPDNFVTLQIYPATGRVNQIQPN